MTVGAALFFVILLASTTLALRWIARRDRWPLAGIALAAVLGLVGLHDATLPLLSGHLAATDVALVGAAPAFSAAEIHDWLVQGSPEPTDGRWHAIRVAVAQARAEAVSATRLHDLQVSNRPLCVGNELTGILAVGISDARSAMLEDLVSQPCRAPGFLLFRRR
jgi:hypothetical protein